MTISKPRAGLWNIGQSPGVAGPTVELGVAVQQWPHTVLIDLSSGNRSFGIDLYTAKLLMQILPDVIAHAEKNGEG